MSTSLATRLEDQRRDTLETVQVRNTDEPDVLFAIPADATDAECETVWMEATGDAFVDLADWQ